MKFTLNIELGNDAMQTGADISDALHKLAGKVYGFDDAIEGERGVIMDTNGNKVGEWEVAE